MSEAMDQIQSLPEVARERAMQAIDEAGYNGWHLMQLETWSVGMMRHVVMHFGDQQGHEQRVVNFETAD
jgi:hypothetical protein